MLPGDTDLVLFFGDPSFDSSDWDPASEMFVPVLGSFFGVEAGPARNYYLMGPAMTNDLGEMAELLRRAAAGDQQALGSLFSHHRDRLRRMVQLRMDRRLQGRLDPSDVLQEAYLEFSRSLADYLREPSMPFFMEEAGPRPSDRSGPFSGPVTADGRDLQRLGDYRILREVGRGGMGIVYEAEQEALGRHVALKVLPFQAAADPTCLQRFRREARSVARLHHSNIVPVHDVGEHQGVHYYAMQFIQGQGLDEVLQELRRMRRVQTPAPAAGEQPAAGLASNLAGGLLSGQFAAANLDEASRGRPPLEVSGAGPAQPPEVDAPGSPEKSPPAARKGQSEFSTQSDFHYYRSVARVGLQVAEALAYAHGQRVLHRDIKPSNLLLDLEGTVWVMDFGLAKEEGEDLTRTGDVVGTLRYMAPERFSGVSDPRSDIYSLGLTLYELLTLRPAFEDSDRGQLIQRVTHEEPPAPRKLDRRVPRDLETIVLKAIAKEPPRRYQTANEMVEDLQRFLADRPIQARRTLWRAQAWRWVRRNPGWAAMLVTVAGLLLVIAVGGVVMSLHLRAALDQARDADRDKTDKLWQSLVDRARAERRSGGVGQRFKSLEAIREAARIRVTPELRTEAIAALALPDMEIARAWDGWPDDTVALDFDDSLERYVRVDKQGGMAVCRLTTSGEEVTARIDPHGQPPFRGPWLSRDGRYVLLGHGPVREGTSAAFRVWKLDGPAPELVLDEEATVYEFAVAFRPPHPTPPPPEGGEG